MSALRKLKSEILIEGSDLAINSDDWKKIHALLPEDRPPNDDDLKVLVEMRSEARTVCPEFDAYFFPTFKNALVADGVICSMEHFQLLQMLYGGSGIDEAERKFLAELKWSLRELSPEFMALYDQAMRD